MTQTGQRTTFALGRLFEAFIASPFAEAWAARSRIEAVVRVLHADGHGIDRDRVLRLSYDLPVSGRIDIGSDAQVLQIIGFLGGGQDGAGHDGPAAAELAEAEAAIGGGDDSRGPEILLGHLWRWLAAGRRPSVGHVAFVRRLAAAGLTPRPLGALASPSGPLRQSERDWVERALGRLADAADAARRDLGALALTVADWRRRLGPRRRQSRMDRLLGEAASMLVVTPAAVARRLGVSLRGASVMLEELAELGIVVEVTGRKSWKVFVPSDLVISLPGDHSRRREIRPAAQSAPPPDLAPLVDDADSAIARVQAAMARLRSAQERASTPANDPSDDAEDGEDQPASRS